MLVPRTAPAPGDTITYDEPLAVHDNVTAPPAATCAGVAVNALIDGGFPVGTFADV